MFLGIFGINTWVWLTQVFSAFGFVQKIAIFQKSAGFQALVQYPGVLVTLVVHSEDESCAYGELRGDRLGRWWKLCPVGNEGSK